VLAIGTQIRVYMNTVNIHCGWFALVCPVLHLTRSMVGKVGLNGHWYQVACESLHIICYKCLGSRKFPSNIVPIQMSGDMGKDHSNSADDL